MPKTPSQKGNQSRLRVGRISEDYAAYAITKVVEHRKCVLTDEIISSVLLESWQFLRQQNRIKLFAYCIMPDHYHLAFCLMRGETLSGVMNDTNKFTAKSINTVLGRSGKFWQSGYYDRNCRNASELHDACIYIEHNPVRAGFVAEASDWSYSSAATSKGMLDRRWWP